MPDYGTHTLRPSCGPFGTRCSGDHDAPLPAPCEACGELPSWCACPTVSPWVKARAYLPTAAVARVEPTLGDPTIADRRA